MPLSSQHDDLWKTVFSNLLQKEVNNWKQYLAVSNLNPYLFEQVVYTVMSCFTAERRIKMCNT